MKKFFLVAILIVSASVAFAQDKYEFMTINYYYLTNKKIGISIDGKEYTQEKIELPKESESVLNTNPLLLKIKEYQDKGWEFISFNTADATGAYIAFLRKKKTN